MKLTTARFFCCCLLFIVYSINGSTTPFKAQAVEHAGSNCAALVSKQSADQRELQQLKDGLHSALRLTEHSTTHVRNYVTIHPFLPLGQEHTFFSKQQYVCYTINRLNRLNAFPLYLRYRNLRI